MEVQRLMAQKTGPIEPIRLIFPQKAMCAGVSTGHGSHGMLCANRPTGLALRPLEPPASASLRRGKPAGILRYFLSIQYLCKPCAVNPPVLPCKHSTFSEYKQFLAFPFIPSSFSKLMTRFFFFAETQKEKANIKSFGKG